MSEARHTPGPWSFGGENVVNFVFDREGCIHPPLSNAGEYQYAGPIAIVAINEDAGGTANARLIAAAPDLLEACEELLAVRTGDGLLDPASDVFIRAAAVVAKAKGA